MSRAEEWEKELIHRFPSIDCDGLPATAEFITILEEMGGFDEGAYLDYRSITHDINIICRTPKCCQIAPVYVGDQVSSFRCMFSLFTIKVQPTSEAIQVFLRTYWSELFPKEST